MKKGIFFLPPPGRPSESSLTIRKGTRDAPGYRVTPDVLAEVDGNRTRQTRIARLGRFEGGGAHQVPRHLRPRR
jgi:hypothetical protein